MIEFGSPWMLLGLLAAAVPLWLHLFGRRRAPVVYFSALDFILAQNPKRARALQLREWILLGLRCLVLALLALALARPAVPWPSRGEALAIGNQPQAVVLIVDDSLSMDATARGETSFELARGRALRLIEALPAGSRAAIVASGLPARALNRQLSADRAALSETLHRLPFRPREDDAARAMALAQNLLEGGADLPVRRVVLLSDLQGTGWRNCPPPVLADDGPTVQLNIDRIDPDSRENTAIVDATVDRQADRTGAQVRVEVTIANHGHRAWRDYVSVSAGEREIKSLVPLQPGETARRSFLVPAAAQWAEVQLPADVLGADNHRTVRLDSATALRVALINGAPRPVARDDEVFFAARALEQAAGGPSEVVVDVLPADKLTVAALADHDVAVAANLAQTGPEGIAALQAYLQSGKGLLVAVGDNLPDPVNGYLRGIVPVELAGLRALGQRNGDNPTLHMTQLVLERAPAATGPVGLAARLRDELMPFADGLAEVRVSHYALVQPTADLAGKVVARFGDGAPALLAGHVGVGRVVLWTSTLDRDWTDFPLQPAYLPWLERTVHALAGSRALERKGAVEVGHAAVLGRDERADQLEVKAETGSDARIAAPTILQAALQRPAMWSVAELDAPGRYTATELRNGVALTSRPLLVLPPHTESDLYPAETGPLAQLRAAPQRQQPGQVPKSPAWTASLVALLLLLVAETAVLARGGRGRKRSPGWRQWLRARWARVG